MSRGVLPQQQPFMGALGLLLSPSPLCSTTMPPRGRIPVATEE